MNINIRQARFAPAVFVNQVTDKESLIVEAIIATEDVALDGNVIRIAGMDIEKGSGSVLFAHLNDQPPVAKFTSLVKRGTILWGRMEFTDEKTNPFGYTIWRLIKGGFLNTMSVSWLPVEWRPLRGGAPGAVEFIRSIFLEGSVVPVPADPGAIITARQRGIDTKPLFDWAELMLDEKREVKIPHVDFEKLRRDAKMPTPVKTKTVAERKVAATVKADEFHGSSKAFRNFGEFLQTVARAGSDMPQVDYRLVRAPTGGNENDPTAGGFMVPATFMEDLIGSLYEDAALAPLVTKLKSTRPFETRLPAIDETSRADGSRWGGASAYWSAEAATQSPSLPKFKSIVFEPKKLISFFVATEELISDAPMLEYNAKRAFQSEISFKVDTAILSGSGAGMPQGILTCPALITVAKEVGQAAATITSKNVDDMWARLPAPCRKRAVWIVNEDADSQLAKMQLVVGSAGSASPNMSYIASGVAGNENPLLKGRPILTIEQSPQLGTFGDVILADLSQYGLVGTEMKTDLSLHVAWLSFQGIFRFTMRIDGKPFWTTPITPYNGGATRSPFVALANR